MTEHLDWDEYFMTMAYFIAMKSKDQSTHVGAVIVGPDNEIRSTGYNNLPRGLNDDLPEKQERPEKYYWFEHAERNAIYNMARMGTSSKDCRLYTQGLPCTDCARAVIQCGIVEVIIHNDWMSGGIWDEHTKRSAEMLKEAGVSVRTYSGPLVGKVVRHCQGLTEQL